MSDERCLWQNGVEQKLEEHHAALEDHHRRLTDLTVASKEHAEAIAANAKNMQKIADNTDEMVDLFKNAQMFRRFVLWAAPYVAAIAAVGTAIKLWWVSFVHWLAP